MYILFKWQAATFPCLRVKLQHSPHFRWNHSVTISSIPTMPSCLQGELGCRPHCNPSQMHPSGDRFCYLHLSAVNHEVLPLGFWAAAPLSTNCVNMTGPATFGAYKPFPPGTCDSSWLKWLKRASLKTNHCLFTQRYTACRTKGYNNKCLSVCFPKAIKFPYKLW